ncbi:RDD family protein [Bacillus sp. V59.32b]|uniref:RDD family protein n=1 Tax=Bacillus sp. V59.32b TaxID=1758642 RepID=UPI000E3C537F|nr:RDD family protein [Bacillus sp. V59.32b]RFU69907.1 RDD family protein [Bacillus sp. V59.32b]
MEQVISNDFQTERKEYAGFWIRFGAYLIDSLIIGIPAFILYLIGFFLIGTSGYVEGTVNDTGYTSPEEDLRLLFFFLVMMVITLIITVLYSTLLHSSKWQATVGKKLVGIKVTDLNGERISFWRAFGRLMAMYLSGIFYIGYIMAAFTEKKQGLHDMIASTLVVKK